VRKSIASKLNLPCGAEGWLMYHFTPGPIRVSLDSCNLIVSLVILLDEHHRANSWPILAMGDQFIG